MTMVEWTFRFAGIVIICAIEENEARAALSAQPGAALTLEAVRDYFEPIASDLVLESGGVVGDAWYFMRKTGKDRAWRAEDTRHWGTSGL